MSCYMTPEVKINLKKIRNTGNDLASDLTLNKIFCGEYALFYKQFREFFHLRQYNWVVGVI